MKTWLILLGGLLVWTFHFFGLYAIAEFAPSSVSTIATVIVLTLLGLAADLWLLQRIRRLPAIDQFSAWRRSVALGGVLLSLVAVCWQSLPALAG